MFNIKTVHIALELWGGIFCLIAALCVFLNKNFESRKRKIMIAMQLSTALLLVMDSFAWAFRGYPGTVGYVMVRISNCMVFVMSDVLLMLFHAYLCSYLFENHSGRFIRNVSHRARTVYVIGGVGVLMVILSQFFDWYYYFDANNLYHRAALHPLALIIPLVGIVIDLTLLVQYRHKIGKDVFVAMCSYVLLPILADIVLLFFYGISLVNLAISISTIFMFITAMAEQSRMLATKEKENAELRITVMLSQIAPHFIYNTLTAIQQLCVTDPKMAYETVGEFATYLRGNIDSLTADKMILFEKELEHTKSYLAIEQKRFGERVKTEFDIQEEYFLIPALTLQPIVENAVKHGVCRKAGGGTIRISTQKDVKEIRVIVQDDGVGFDTKQQSKDGEVHVGIQNVASRIRTVCGGSLTVESEIGKGTTVVIHLPLKDKEDKL